MKVDLNYILPMFIMACVESPNVEIQEDSVTRNLATRKDVQANGRSSQTSCAENDNISVYFTGMVKAHIEARHPEYKVDHYDCPPNFENCNMSSENDYPSEPMNRKLYDNGISVVTAHSQATWWKPQGMKITVEGGRSVENAHYVALSRKVSGQNSWPQFLVLYSDGHLRLIPHPPAGTNSVCFGSSFIVGPMQESDRPFAAIESILVKPRSGIIDITYVDQTTSTITVEELDRRHVKVTIEFAEVYRNPSLAFISMFVENGNADVDHIEWEGSNGQSVELPILDFHEGVGNQWSFHRRHESVHNESAPGFLVIFDEVD